jgi:hypothetical protein
MAVVIATVVSISGNAFVRDIQGQTRALRPGEALHEGDTLLTDEGARVELLDVGGDLLTFGGGERVLMSAELAEPIRPDADAAQLAQGTVDQVVQALATGGEIDELIEDPAAGLGGGGGGEGSNFVRLLRIAEGVTPLAFDFGFIADEEPLLLFGGEVDAVPAETLTVTTTQTVTQTQTQTASATQTFTSTESLTDTVTATETDTSSPTATDTGTATDTTTPTDTATATETDTSSPTDTATGTATDTTTPTDTDT